MLAISNKKKLLILTAVILIVASIFILINVFPKFAAQKSNFSKLSWTEAFSKLHERMAKEYAFTEWKGIDWPELYEEYQKRIEAAQLNNDFEAYYICLRNYIHELADGHVSVNNLREINNKHIGGGFGLATAKLDNGKIIVTWVDESGPAWVAGIRAGAELIEWDGQPAIDAARAVSTKAYCSDKGLALLHIPVPYL